MIVQRFLAWVENAPAGARAEATSALARAYLYSDLEERDRADAETALTSMLDDASPLVRRALAEAFASASEAPHHCVSALARDQSDIAAIVLARSPLLSDAELVDCAVVGDVFAQSAIALRPGLSAAVAAALTEVGAREALISLAVNGAADVPENLLRRMIERFGADGEMREAILSRPDLPVGLHAELLRATARALSEFVVGREWMPEERARRMTREATEKGAITIAARDGNEVSGALRDLARALRRSGQLTPAFALRALLSGARELFVAIMAELSGLPAPKVAGLINRPAGAGFAALYGRAGLPAVLAPAFRHALAADRDIKDATADEHAGRLSRSRVIRARADLEKAGAVPASGELNALLRNFEAEAAREEARTRTPALASAGRPGAAPEIRVQIDLDAIAAELALA